MKNHRFNAMEKRRRLRLAALLGASAMAVPFATPALAQTSEAATVDSNTIIVTAQRRNEALEDVPMTVQVVSQETLSSLGVNSVRDLQNVTTGFQIGNSGTYPQPSIRGVTTINAGAYENNVAVYVDGLYQFTPQVLNMDLPNVQNIQVLKGPQSTLYGRNATGGAILIDTIDPGSVWTGNGELTYARFDDKRARAFVAGPISEKVGISLAGTYRHTDGYYKKASLTTPGQFDGRTLGLKQESFRAKFKADLTDTFRATIGYAYTHASDPRGTFFTPTENVLASYADNPATPFVDGNTLRPTGLGEVAGDVFELNFKQNEVLLKLEMDTGIGTLRSVSGYTSGSLVTTFDAAGSYVADNFSTSDIRDKTWQESIDFNIDAIEKLDLVVGGTYFHIDTEYAPGKQNVVYLAPASALGRPGTPLSSYQKFSETAFFRTKEAWALFADATFHATDKLSISVGGRYSEETQDVSGYKVTYNPATGVPVSCAYSISGETHGGLPCGATVNGVFQLRPSANSSKYSKFTPRATIRYEITPGTNVYASYSTGFRSGEWNSVIPGDNPAVWADLGEVGQESVNAFEVGVKHAGGRLRFEAAGFYYDYKDLQVSFTQFVNNVALVTLQQVPKAEIYGAEASFDYEVIDNLTVRAGATWLHARYGDGAIFNGSGVCANTCALANKQGFNSNSDPLKTLANDPNPHAMDISGMQMARAPNFTAFAGFDYLIPQGDGGIRIAANVKYTDSYVVTNPSIWGGESASVFAARRALNPNAMPDNFATLRGTPYEGRAEEQRARQGNYALVNASVTWTDPTDHYYVRVWGNNLTDVKYRVHYNPLSGGAYTPIGEPLTFGGTVGYKF